MNSSRSRALAGVAALTAVVLVLFALGCGDDESSTTAAATTAEQSTTTAEGTTTNGGGQGGGETTTADQGDAEIPTIVIEGGEPVDGVAELSFTEGDEIRFKVESDVADEVHFHGYDVGMDVEAGGSVTFDVPATITGVFEVELEQLVVPIAEITVNPA